MMNAEGKIMLGKIMVSDSGDDFAQHDFALR
jgi:hypothetical protein